MSWVTVGTMAAGAVMGKMKNDAAQKRQEQTANAAADAQRVSWARRPGAQQFVPAVQYNPGSEGQSIFEGGLTGAMFGQQLSKSMPAAQTAGANAPMDWKNLPELQKPQMLGAASQPSMYAQNSPFGGYNFKNLYK